jgi:membrane associated rhomboid family serine protease
VFDLIERHRIDCQPVRAGWLQLSYSDKAVPALHARAKQWAKRGVPVEVLDRAAVARRVGDLKFLYFSVLCGVAGAFTHLAFHFGDMAPVVGASAAISGQMAGALRFIFKAQRLPGERTPDFIHAPLMSLGQTLRDQRILLFLVFWVGINAYFGLSAVKIAGQEGGIAWEAHIGGFVCGLLLFGLFDKGGAASEETPRLP